MKLEKLKTIVENSDTLITGDFSISIEWIQDSKSLIDKYELAHIIGHNILNQIEKHLNA